MKPEKQVCTLEQGRRTAELGVDPTLASMVWTGKDKCYTVKTLNSLEDDGDNTVGFAAPAFTVAEMLQVLRGKMPYWIAIWGEWGYKSKNGQGVGYSNMAEACGWRLIEALETKELTAEEVNQKLQNS